MFYKNILVVGAPRSGTTLLSGIITGSNEVFPNLPECTILTQVIEHYFNIIHYTDEERFRLYARDNKTLLKIYKLHISNMIENLTEQFTENHYKFLVMKDPMLTKYIDLIPDFFGNSCKILYIIRNPLSIISSLIKAELKKDIVINEENIISEIFNYFYIAHESKLYKNNELFTVEYEKLVDCSSVISQIENYLGYSFNHKPFERSCFKFDKNDPTFSINYGSNVLKTLDTYSQILSQSTIDKIKYIFSGYNQKYNWWID